MRRIGLMGLIGLVVASCTSEVVTPEVVEPEADASVPVEVRCFVTDYVEAEPRMASRAGGTTRAWIPPTGFFTYEGDNSIGISFTKDGHDPVAEETMGYFFKSTDTWRSSVNITEVDNFYLYGYFPHTTGMSCTVTDRNGNTGEFSKGAVLKINNVSSVSPSDVCVLVGAKNGKDDYRPEPEDFSVAGLVPGKFVYRAEAMGDGGGSNYAFLLFDHLFSALQLRFNVDATYATMRTIKIKQLRLRTYTDVASEASVNLKKCNVTVKLKATDDGSSPIEDITFEPTGDPDTEGSVFFSSEAGDQLPVFPDTKAFVANFMPQGVKKVVLTSTYDVYDKKGNLVRQNSEASNTITIDLFSGQTQTLRGRRYILTLTVNPTYLYMMSDPDLDSPTLVVS